MKLQTLPIPGLEDRYTISNKGAIYSLLTGKKMAHFVEKMKSGNVTLTAKLGPRNARKSVHVAALVARLFVPNPKGYTHFVYRDNNRYNCHAWNLRWIDDETWVHITSRRTGKANKGRPAKEQDSKLIKQVLAKPVKSVAEGLLAQYYMTGEASHLWAIFLHLRPKLWSYAYHIGVKADDYHDTVMDAWAYFLTCCESGSVGTSVETQLYNAIKWQFLKTWRSRKQLLATDDLDMILDRRVFQRGVLAHDSGFMLQGSGHVFDQVSV